MTESIPLSPTKSAGRNHRVRNVKRVTGLSVAIISLGGAFVTAVPANAETATDASSALLMPFYTEKDLTGDAQVTVEDLEVLAESMGYTVDSDGWGDIARGDLDGDGAITITDLAGLSQRMLYDDGTFEIIEATALDMQAAMNAGVTTSVEITQQYLDRIAAYDRTILDTSEGGRALNSIISTSDAALEAAAAADAERASNGMMSMLLGIPVAVKDNYNTTDMATTAGCGCWDDNWTTDDAAMVTGLRQSGAVLLAKTSLDEFAYGFESQFSANQVAGETLYVASPYATDRTAGGSSGGTGAAIAANLAGIGFGTDTGGSIRVPASYNQLVGIRPTVGLASRDGIVPLALTQDTGGPMARSVIDAAVALDAVVGVDENDPVTATQAGHVPVSYTEFLDRNALEGARIGYIPSMLGSNPTTLRLWSETKALMEAQGATIVEIEAPAWFASVLGEGSGSTNEFRHDLAEYVDAYLSPDMEARTIDQIIESGRFVTSRQRTYESRANVTEDDYLAWAGPEGSHSTALAEFKVQMTGLLDDLALDAMVYPSGNTYGTQGSNLRLSPNTGMPSVTVPMGQAIEIDGTITGAGVNLEIYGRDFAEGELLGFAYAIEQANQARTTPALYGPLG